MSTSGVDAIPTPPSNIEAFILLRALWPISCQFDTQPVGYDPCVKIAAIVRRESRFLFENKAFSAESVGGFPRRICGKCLIWKNSLRDDRP